MTDTRVQITHEEGWDLEEGMIVEGGIECLKGLLAVFLYISGRRRGGCGMENEFARVALVGFVQRPFICLELYTVGWLIP